MELPWGALGADRSGHPEGALVSVPTTEHDDRAAARPYRDPPVT